MGEVISRYAAVYMYASVSDLMDIHLDILGRSNIQICLCTCGRDVSGAHAHGMQISLLHRLKVSGSSSSVC